MIAKDPNIAAGRYDLVIRLPKAGIAIVTPFERRNEFHHIWPGRKKSWSNSYTPGRKRPSRRTKV